MTEAQIISEVPVWTMPAEWQSITLIIFGLAGLSALLTSIYLAWQWKSAIPLCYFLAAVLTINLEPMIARLSSASHAQVGQITAFVSEGRAIPWHVLLVYTAYFGYGYFFLVPALRKRQISARLLWIGYGVGVLGAWVFEAPFIWAGLWDYFGPQSWKPFGLMPVYFAFANMSACYIGCALLAAVEPYLLGIEKGLVIILAPAFTIGGHIAVCWPTWNFRTSVWPAAGANIGAAITVVLCLVSTMLVARAFGRTE